VSIVGPRTAPQNTPLKAIAFHIIQAVTIGSLPVSQSSEINSISPKDASCLLVLLLQLSLKPNKKSLLTGAHQPAGFHFLAKILNS